MVEKSIKKLVCYGLECGLFTERDQIFVTNRILEILNIDEYDCQENFKDVNLEETLKELLDFAAEKGLIGDNITERDLFDTKLMSALLPPPSVVTEKVEQKIDVKIYEEVVEKETVKQTPTPTQKPTQKPTEKEKRSIRQRASRCQNLYGLRHRDYARRASFLSHHTDQYLGVIAGERRKQNPSAHARPLGNPRPRNHLHGLLGVFR